jgi:hypothetical protein
LQATAGKNKRQRLMLIDKRRERKKEQKRNLLEWCIFHKECDVLKNDNKVWFGFEQRFLIHFPTAEHFFVVERAINPYPPINLLWRARPPARVPEPGVLSESAPLPPEPGQLRPLDQIAVKRLRERASAEGTVRAAFAEILLDPALEARPAQEIAATAVDRDTLKRPDLVVADRARVACLDGARPC